MIEDSDNKIIEISRIPKDYKIKNPLHPSKRGVVSESPSEEKGKVIPFPIPQEKLE